MTDDRCPTCEQPLPQISRCRCGHPMTEHRLDLTVWPCGHGCRIPGLACSCKAYEPIEDTYWRDRYEEQAKAEGAWCMGLRVLVDRDAADGTLQLGRPLTHVGVVR